MGVVVEPPARHKSGQIGGNGVEFEAGNEQREVVRVHADVGEAGRRAGARGIGSPFRLFLA